MWRIDLLFLALGVIKELLKFLRENRKCVHSEQKSILLGIKSQIAQQTAGGEEVLRIVV